MENHGRSGYYGRGRGRGRGRSPYSGHHTRGDEPSVVGSSSTNFGVYREKSPHQSSSTNYQKNLKPKQTQQWRPLSGVKDASLNAGNPQQEHNPAGDVGNVSERPLESLASNSVSDKEHSSSCDQNVSEDLQSGVASLQIGEPIAESGNDSNPLLYDHCNRFDAAKQLKDKNSSIKLMENNVSDCKESEDPKPPLMVPFDICPSKEPGVIKLNVSLLVKNREKRNEMKRAEEGNKEIVLRPGMVLLKRSISLGDQVTVVKMCQKLGVGSGGFYQPGYREGGKLHLKMMCLGKNWDPETSTYGEIRPIDNAKPPSIPVEFDKLVEKAMNDSYAALVRKDSKAKNPEHLLPWMKPNICIVNFYSENGQLGLHQDRDEGRESLHKGLPVVSFSIGDSAEFLFGDKSDPIEAEKVTLESGDILIFGGKSRHVFHGVTAIHPNTAPKALLEATNLRSGRLNLTFRESY